MSSAPHRTESTSSSGALSSTRGKSPRNFLARAIVWRTPILATVVLLELVCGYLLVALNTAIPLTGAPAPEVFNGLHPGVFIAVVYTCGLGALAGALLLLLPRWPVPIFMGCCVLAAATGLAVPATIGMIRLSTTASSRRLFGYISAYGLALIISSFSPYGQAIGRVFFEEHTAQVGAILTRLMFLLVAVIGVFLIRSSKRIDELERARVRRAEDERTLMVETAVLSERNRIAREMHDAIGHKISLIALHAGGLQLRETDPEKRVPIAVIRDAATGALTELRQVLAVLRDGAITEMGVDSPVTLADISSLVEESRAANIRITYNPTTAHASPSTAQAVYRIVQEGLANIHRHAPEGDATLTITSDSAHLRILLENTFIITDELVLENGCGNGLVGIAERAHHLGGSATWRGSNDGIWVLEATLPNTVDTATVPLDKP